MGAHIDVAEPLGELLARFGAIRLLRSVIRRSISLSAVLGGAPDPSGILAYLGSLGIAPHHLNDLLLVKDYADEEELYAHRVAEGVAVSIASQGDWVLFGP